MDINVINSFIEELESGRIEIYNEFSLQHELGIYLRNKLPGYKIQFERNANYFNIADTIKHEIDIVVFDENSKYAIELKYPLNGQYPEEMFSFIKDIKFMEQIKENGFDKTFCLTIVEDSKFYSGRKLDGIYSYFRNNEEIHGKVTKPTGEKDEIINIDGKYCIHWKQCGKRKYYFLEI